MFGGLCNPAQWAGVGVVGLSGKAWKVWMGLIYTVPWKVPMPSEPPPFQNTPLERVYGN